MGMTDVAASSSSGWATWIPVVAAIVALAGVAAATWQKAINDRRDQWWKRAQWAMERLEPSGDTPDDLLDERRAVAIETISYLTESGLAGPDEYAFFDKLADQVLAEDGGVNG